jgi:GNAT superfamily N-acetyltransferase
VIDVLDLDGFRAAVPDLGALLVDAVDHGASVNFLAGLTLADAGAWWADRTDHVADGTVTAIVAREVGTGRVIGSTLLIRARQPNAPHRAEIGKVLVHSTARRQGLARRLMSTAETIARADGRWLLVLDTQAGTDAEVMYRVLGWQELGTMPDHSLRPDGVPAPTTYFWKDLRAPNR